MEMLSEGQIRQLSYSELRKYAKNRGLKTNLKAEKLISALLSDSRNSSKLNEESFSVNSQVNFENFNQDNAEFNGSPVLDTPRRETYSVETPTFFPQLVDEKENEEESGMEDKMVTRRKKFSVENPAFPQIVDLKDSVVKANTSITAGGSVKEKLFSGRKSLSRSRRSLTKSKRKSSKSKVSFITPAKRSPRLSGTGSGASYASVKNRPKTPAAIKSVSSSHKPSTRKSTAEANAKVTTPKSAKLPDSCKSTRTPRVTPFKLKPSDRQKLVFDDSHDDKGEKESDKNKVGNGKKEQETQTATPNRASKKSKVVLPKYSTPNFKKIHQKAFDKMESLDEYHRRMETVKKSTRKGEKISSTSKNTSNNIPKMKTRNATAAVSAKTSRRRLLSKIPNFISGVPFIPTVTSVSKIKTNFSALPAVKKDNMKCQKGLFKKDDSTVMHSSKKRKILSVQNNFQENQTRRKTKFDLAASLARKLPYKPYTGPVKPLPASSVNVQPNKIECQHKNPKIEQYRSASRDVLRGVRNNRRFDLQMTKRGLK